MTVGTRLREARGGRSVAEVAKQIGVTRQTWYRWEVDQIEVPRSRYLEVSDVLGAPWEQLFAPDPRPVA